MTHFVFPNSAFLPVIIGFFGLGTGYFIWGGQALFGFPASSPEVNRRDAGCHLKSQIVDLAGEQFPPSNQPVGSSRA